MLIGGLGKKVAHFGFFWVVIGGEGLGTNVQWVSRGCSRADLTYQKHFDLIWSSRDWEMNQ